MESIKFKKRKKVLYRIASTVDVCKELKFEIKALNYYLDSIIIKDVRLDSAQLYLEKSIYYDIPYYDLFIFYQDSSSTSQFKKSIIRQAEHNRKTMGLPPDDSLQYKDPLRFTTETFSILELKKYKGNHPKLQKKIVYYSYMSGPWKHKKNDKLIRLHLAKKYGNKYYVKIRLSTPSDFNRLDMAVLVIMDKEANVLEVITP